MHSIGYGDIYIGMFKIANRKFPKIDMKWIKQIWDNVTPIYGYVKLQNARDHTTFKSQATK